MKLNFCFLLFFLFIICFYIFPQEEDNNQTSFPEEDSNIYVINSFVYNINGRTRPFALVKSADLIIGEEINGDANLEKYIQNKTQLLTNQRVLESVYINYSIREADEGGKYPVDIIITVVDTWNIIAIPYPEYDSNTGFEISVKARNFNFLGTMSPLRIDLGYRNDENNLNFFNFLLDSDTPFRAFDLNWSLKFYNFFEYRPDMELPYFYENTTGISVDLPIKSTTLTLGFNESFIFNEENTEANMEYYGLNQFQKGLYMSSEPYISWKIPTGLEIGNYGELTYTPKFSATFNHELPEWPLDEIRKGPFLNFNHTLGFGRVNWIGNFQDGAEVKLSNGFNYDFFKQRNDLEPLTISYSISGIRYFNIDEFLGISSRVMFRHWINYEYGYEEAGDVLRGILDKDVKADLMLSFNLDVVVRFIKARPSEWFKTSKLRIIDFDMHIGPFLDVAFFNFGDNARAKELKGYDFTYKNLLLCSGVEVIVFPAFMRSLFLRASLGLNFSMLTGLSSRELYIGTELYY